MIVSNFRFVLFSCVYPCYHKCQMSSGVNVGNGGNIFLIEQNGGTVAWRPDSNSVSSTTMWNSLLKSLRHKFGKRLKLGKREIQYNAIKNVIPNKDNYENGELNKSSIVMYWNLLKSSKDSSQMYFYIGDLPKDDTKRAVIISSKSMEKHQKKDFETVINFENEDDWDENYKQLMEFLRNVYNFNNDEIDYDDYEEHPFKIYQIEPGDLDKIVQEARSGNVNKFETFIEKYDSDAEIEDSGTLEDYFNSNEDCNKCGMYVTYKKYFLFCWNKGSTVYRWAPSKYCIQDNDDIDWDYQFFKMKKAICQCFNLLDNDALEFVCDDAFKLKTAWEELIDSEDSLKYNKIEVTGQVWNVFFFFLSFVLILLSFLLLLCLLLL